MLLITCRVQTIWIDSGNECFIALRKAASSSVPKVNFLVSVSSSSFARLAKNGM